MKKIKFIVTIMTVTAFIISCNNEPKKAIDSNNEKNTLQPNYIDEIVETYKNDAFIDIVIFGGELRSSKDVRFNSKGEPFAVLAIGSTKNDTLLVDIVRALVNEKIDKGYKPVIDSLDELLYNAPYKKISMLNLEFKKENYVFYISTEYHPTTLEYSYIFRNDDLNRYDNPKKQVTF